MGITYPISKHRGSNHMGMRRKPIKSDGVRVSSENIRGKIFYSIRRMTDLDQVVVTENQLLKLIKLLQKEYEKNNDQNKNRTNNEKTKI